jgi:hypothetical protein
MSYKSPHKTGVEWIGEDEEELKLNIFLANDDRLYRAS